MNQKKYKQLEFIIDMWYKGLGLHDCELFPEEKLVFISDIKYLKQKIRGKK